MIGSALLHCSPGLKGIFGAYSLSLLALTLTTRSVLWAVCCGAVTSLSPRCHPAGEGFRRAQPLPKPHSATSAIHKRQPLPHILTLLHFTLSLYLSLTHLLFILISAPFVHSFKRVLPFSSLLVLFTLATGSSLICHSLPLSLSLCLFFSPFQILIHVQWKNVSPIMSSAGSQLSVVAVS